MRLMSTSSTVRDLLDRADAERAAGRGDAASSLYDEAAARCRDTDDLDGWTQAVLGAATVYVFGAEPGKLPAQLYDVLARTTDDATRARLGAALTRCWAYAGQAARAGQFATEAIECAERTGVPALVADCLDAALAAHWGPDELEVRRSLTQRLDDVAAHVLDPDARLQAHLWGLQVACEALDLQAIHRQLRALERLGEESPRALFFAASRRLMLDQLRGRTDSTAGLIEIATKAAGQAALPDSWMVLMAMTTYAASQSGDTKLCATGAAGAEAFALSEGITVMCAEAAYLWTCAGDLPRTRALVHTFHGTALDDLPRDVNWLLTLQCVLEAALAVADREVVGKAATLLGPYEGRAVFNAGAVWFHGVTDDTLARAAALLGDPVTADRLRTRALATYERISGTWWRERLESWQSPGEPVAHDNDQAHFHPVPGGLWLIGRSAAGTPLRELRGFGYLRELLRRPRQPVAALDLVGANTAIESGLGGVLDEQALKAYRQRLRDLDQELAEAEEWSDLDRLSTVRLEREALLDELARGTGLGGRTRTTGSSQERARVAVKKAISGAVDRNATIDDPLARHLRTSIHTGLTCSYDPGPADTLRWILD
jgi:tetratricopeptide (TPR) repeat protein